MLKHKANDQNWTVVRAENKANIVPCCSAVGYYKDTLTVMSGFFSDPYVKVYLLHRGKRREKWKTSTKKGTLAPVFNELFQFDVSNMQINDVTLQLVLMDFDRFVRNDRMGTIQIGDNSRQMSGQTHWRQMCLSPRQTISHWHSFLPVGRHLESYDSMDYPQ